ncbi:TPA: hypothetical protein JAN90_12025 [Legionella pneumophila]|uniref:hypothetical protein n=1 Tax=Legionella sp. PC1000 TaxID=2746060 RepID=UPI0015FCE8A6|nr:hypothetical protein [Legionella sp. PC1000]QLZ70889.1 hypothetical protein FOLKNPGA_03708 [Legionella sp. PC1000]HAT7073472.1 hypothetical protein [Legionella pneumophila]HAT9471190.1 hypothetical protein [Legionella pneumophila subsp. pneumophila]HAT9921658.1 hypothetical protein [Legionella pneumophila subsp. pneumophila]
MSLIYMLEKMAYEPLSDANQILNKLNQKNLNNNSIREQLIKELAIDNSNIRYDLFACETHVVSVN